jgi:hypothetical protein
MLSFCPQDSDNATPEYYFERLVASFVFRSVQNALFINA